MMRYFFFLSFVIAMLFTQIGLAQSADGSREDINFQAERLLIHTDRELYISGEVIWFKVLAFSGSGQPSDFSRVAYLELISPEQLAISRVKISLAQGQGNGTIELPQVLNSGKYVLRAYTQAMRNGKAVDFATAGLIILNPNQAVVRADADHPEAYADFVPSHTVMAVQEARMMNITIEQPEVAGGQRSAVTLEITTTDAAGQPLAADLSLSVALKASEESGAKPLYVTGPETGSGSITRPEAIDFPPEDRAMRLNGRVIDEATQAGAPEAQVFLAFPGETALVYLATTDEDGAFSMLLPQLYGLRQVVLQTHPEDNRSLRLELAEAFHPITPAEKKTFILPPEWVPAANAAMVNAQVRQSYQSFELPAVYETPALFDTVPFFGHPEAGYRLDDYTRFPLPEFFFEIVIEVGVRGKYGSEELEVINDWEDPFGNPEPLLLVDGVPVFDQRTFLKINNKLIESAEIVTEPFWLNPLFYNGVIQLTSFEKDGRCFRLPGNALQRSFLTLLPERRFPIPDHQAKPDSRLPDFRNTLYWNPAVRTDENGKATVTFYTADNVGDFEIHVEGISKDGHVGSSIDMMEVVKEVK